jgi:hypothetical protein
MHLLHPPFFILRHRKVGPLKISGACSKPHEHGGVRQPNNFRGTPISLPRLFSGEKSRTWLHTLRFFARYLSKQRKSMAKDAATIYPQRAMVTGSPARP